MRLKIINHRHYYYNHTYMYELRSWTGNKLNSSFSIIWIEEYIKYLKENEI